MLYGRGSSGGLINRVTKKPVFGTQFGEVSLGLGSHSHKRATADLNVPIGEAMAFRLNVAREKCGSYRDQQFTDRYNIAPSLGIKFSSQTDLLLQYTNLRDQRLTDFGVPALNGRPVDVPIGTYYGSAHAPRDDTVTSKVQTFTATLNHRFSDAMSLRNTARYSSYHLDRFNTLPSGTTDPRDRVEREERDRPKALLLGAWLGGQPDLAGPGARTAAHAAREVLSAAGTPPWDAKSGSPFTGTAACSRWACCWSMRSRAA